MKASRELQTATVSAIKISRKDLFMNSQEVSIDAPLALCDQFGCTYVCYVLSMEEATNEASSESVCV